MSMKVSYFPGCTLKNKARELDIYARESALALGVELVEIENWQCCGGVFSTATDERATKLSCVRALSDAAKHSQMLVSVCSACHNVLKQTNHAMQTNSEFALRVNNYISPEPAYLGQTRVLHYLELLRDVIGFDKVRQAVKNPLEGKKIGAYYGCLLLRPSSTMQMDDAENPSIMEDFIRALGGEPVIYSSRNECCGAYVTLENASFAAKKSQAILHDAEVNGADIIVTACPLCRYNLMKNGGASGEKVVYFTELLAQALGIKEELA